MRRGNDWERRFGAARRRRDRELLAELERQIALGEALAGIEAAIRAPVLAQREAEEARERLARVFGRPI